MTEPGASLEDPWVKASPAGEHAVEGSAGRARASGVRKMRAVTPVPRVPLLPPPGRGPEKTAHPARAEAGGD